MKYVALLNKDVPRAARFYAHGLGLAGTLCAQRWAELPSRLLSCRLPVGAACNEQRAPFLSFNVTDVESAVTRLLSMGAELDGPVKYPPYGKVAAVRCIAGHMIGLFEPADVPQR